MGDLPGWTQGSGVQATNRGSGTAKGTGRPQGPRGARMEFRQQQDPSRPVTQPLCRLSVPTSPWPDPGAARWLCRHPRRRDDGRSWRRLPPRGEDDPPRPGQQPPGSPRGGAPSRPPQPSPALPYAPEIQLTLTPFSEPTLQRFLHIERPEGMDISTMAGALEEPWPPPPAPTGPLVLPAPQAFSSIGQLYHGIERGLRGLVDRYGEGQVFVGSPNAQASPRYFRVPEPMPELVPVTGLASAAQAIETIVEEGEGARGSWQGAHFGRFLTMLEDYQALAADDPSSAPVHPAVANPLSGAAGPTGRVRRERAGHPRRPLQGPPHPRSVHRRGQRPVQRLLRDDAAAAVPLLPPHRRD
jgi:hypothetical protein